MELRVGDIVLAYHKTLPRPPKDVVLYKVIELRANQNTVPSIVQIVSKDLTEESVTIKDIWNDWHNYTWTVYKDIKTTPLSEADKKYEKIILKIRSLDNRFKTRKELR